MNDHSTNAFMEVLTIYNQSIWPAQLTALFLSTLLLGLLMFPRVGSDRLISGLLALGWLWTGLVFMEIHLIKINWAAQYFGIVFATQGLLMIWSGLIKDRFRFNGDKSAASWFGLLLVIFALIIYPLGAIFVYGFSSVQLAGLAPTPLAILTMGILLLCANNSPVHLAAIPIVWSCADGATALNLGNWWDLSLPAAGLATTFFFIARPRRAQESSN